MFVKLRTGAKMFKTLVDVLKDILMDVNVEFTKDGVHIRSVDPEKMCILDIHLETFDHEYQCDSPVVFGLHLPLLYKCLRTVTSTDILEISIFHDQNQEETVKVMKLSIHPTEADISRSVYLPPIDLIPDEIPLNVPEYKNFAVVDMKELQKALKDVSHLSKKVTFTVQKENPGGLNLYSYHAMASSTVRVSTSDATIEEENVSKEFYCRNLEKILKLHFLEKEIRIDYDLSDNPIMFTIQTTYDLAWKIRLFIAPIS